MANYSLLVLWLSLKTAYIYICNNSLDVHINNIDDNIKFTCDPENDCRLPFLDTLITKKPNSSIKVSVYRKATHTD